MIAGDAIGLADVLPPDSTVHSNRRKFEFKPGTKGKYGS
ncbi:hypothetical protein Q669_04030 [Labrenzia sp. C1B10]|nr:hypothetical protein Q669_04030 [Labrenzia sp. C1B10]ERS05131.1 hypothetical protein Q675_01890 [Labrenzia sp. C1B70]